MAASGPDTGRSSNFPSPLEIRTSPPERHVLEAPRNPDLEWIALETAPT